MDKIRALLQKCNISPDAAESICEAFQQYETQLRETVETEFNERVQAAKRICAEEVETYKAELARKVQIFCEANVARIEQHVARNAQGREGQATSTLEQVKGLLEGVPFAADASTEELRNLRTKNKKLAEERDHAVRVAKRHQSIAESVLRRNKDLETRVALSEQEEITPTRGRNPVNESRNQSGNRRIDQSRTGAQPRTTRRTLAESQDRNAQHDNREGNVRTGGGTNTVLTPAQIAASMPDDM